MKTVESRDGTEIAYDVEGAGPSLVLVGGALNTRMSPRRLVSLLTEHFTVYTYDRRGRGDSGSTDTTTPADEIDDLEAVLYAAGGAVNVFGHSSGAILSLETAVRGDGIARLAIYEPPFVEGSPMVADDIHAALGAGDNSRAVELFLSSTGANTAWMMQQPWWGGMAALAPSLPREFDLVGTGAVPVDRYAAIGVPTLAMFGGESLDWAGSAVRTIAEVIPAASVQSFDGQGHNPDDELLAAALVAFFTAV